MEKDVKRMSTEEKTKSVQRDYDDIASEYCNEFCGTEVYNGFIDKWLQTIQRGNILDVGCGGGNNCQYINEKDEFQAYGIDFSDGMIEQARKRYPNVKIKKMDMTNITFPDLTFDGISIDVKLTQSLKTEFLICSTVDDIFTDCNSCNIFLLFRKVQINLLSSKAHMSIEELLSFETIGKNDFELYILILILEFDF